MPIVRAASDAAREGASAGPTPSLQLAPNPGEIDSKMRPKARFRRRGRRHRARPGLDRLSPALAHLARARLSTARAAHYVFAPTRRVPVVYVPYPAAGALRCRSVRELAPNGGPVKAGMAYRRGLGPALDPATGRAAAPTPNQDGGFSPQRLFERLCMCLLPCRKLPGDRKSVV